MSTPVFCDYQYDDGAFCDAEAVYVALSSALPALWDNSHVGHASIGGFCPRHVTAEQRPSRSEAMRTQGAIESQAGAHDRAIWTALIAHYPEPLRIEDEHEWLPDV